MIDSKLFSSLLKALFEFDNSVGMLGLYSFLGLGSNTEEKTHHTSLLIPMAIYLSPFFLIKKMISIQKG
jgi:hypothetical protein